MKWLDMLILFFCCVVEVFLLYDYFGNFFEIKIKKSSTRVIYVITVCAVYLINLFQNNILNLIIVPILLWMFITILFDAQWEVRLVYFIIAYIVMISVEFLYSIISNTTVELLSQTGLMPVSQYLWQLLLIKFLNYIVFIILKQTSQKSKKKITNKLFLIYLCVPVSTLGTMLVVFYSGIETGKNEVLNILMTLFWIFMMVGNMILFYAFQKYTENLSENSKQELELIYQRAEVERLTKISKWNDDYNEIIHNTSHYLKVISELAYEGRNEEICSLIEKLNVKLNRENIYEYSNHKMLNVILSEYSLKAHDKGIIFDAYVEPGCMLSHIQDIDFITMLGNLLDNAIFAASKKEKEVYVKVRIFMQKDGKLCLIKVVNDFLGEIKEIEGKLISTKKESGVHGIGLSSVSRLAQKYNGYLEYYIENGKFNTIIVLPV